MNDVNNYETEIDLKEYIQILWQKKWWIIGLFIISVSLAIGIVEQLDPIYQTASTILIQKNDGMQNLFQGGMFPGSNNDTGTYTNIIKSRSILKQVIEDMDLRDEEGRPLKTALLQKKLIVSAVAGTDLIRITIEDKNPQKAKAILDHLVEKFQESNMKMNKASLSGARQFIENQKSKIEVDLQMVENQLLEYKTNNDVILPTEEAKGILEKLVEIEELKSKAEIELGVTASSSMELQRELEKHSEQIISNVVTSNNPLIVEYKGQITGLESKLVGLKSKYTGNNSEIVALEEQLSTLEEALSKEVKKEISAETTSINPIYQSLYRNLVDLEINRLANEAKITGYDNLIKSFELKLEGIPQKELELLRLERKAKVTGEIYTMLMTRAEEVKISEAMQTSDVYLIDPAFIPDVPVKPNKKVLIAFAGILAIMAGVLLVFLIEFFDNTVKSAEEIDRMLNLPVLGSIPDIKKMKNS